MIDYRSHGQQSVGVNTLRADSSTQTGRSRLEELDHQLSLLATLEGHAAGFRESIQVRDFDRLLAAKRAYLDRRKRLVGASLPVRSLTVARHLIGGDYLPPRRLSQGRA